VQGSLVADRAGPIYLQNRHLGGHLKAKMAEGATRLTREISWDGAKRQSVESHYETKLGRHNIT
jgi:hypothetical protein